MKKRPHPSAKKHDLIIAVALLCIVGAGVVYARWLWRWMSGTPAAQPAVQAKADVPAELKAARSAFRSQYLDVRAHIRLAEALYKNGRPVDGFYVLYEARRLFGREAFAQAHSLIVLHKERHFLGTEAFDPSPENEARLTEQLKGGERPDLVAYLAQIKALRGELRDAIAMVDKALARWPDDAGLLAARAKWSLKDLGDPAGAIVYLARLAARAPDTYHARSAVEELGRLAQDKDYALAELSKGALQELLERRPDDPRLFAAAAMAAWGRGELENARMLAEHKLAKSPRNAGALLIDGALALSERKLEKALASLTASWELDPSPPAAAKLAELHVKHRGDLEAAIPFYAALYRDNPDAVLDGAVERRLREILDQRREALLKKVLPTAVGTYLISPDASLRAEACARAGGTQDPDWIQQLAELLDDDTEIVRHNADFALFKIGQKHRDVLLSVRMDLLKNRRPLVRIRALNLYADLDKANTFPLAVAALQDPEPAVRLMAKVMVFDHYYKDVAQGQAVVAQYLAAEKDPSVLALLERLTPKPPEPPKDGADRHPRPPQRRPVRR